jgi:FkbH-like protein
MKRVKLRLVSDISTQLIEREFEAIDVVESVYTPIPVWLARADGAEQDIPVLLYSEPIFLRHSIALQLEILEGVERLASRFPEQVVLCSNLIFVPPPWRASRSSGSRVSMEILSLQNKLAKRANVWFVDAQACLDRLGRAEAYHYAMGHQYQMPYRLDFVRDLAKEIESQLLLALGKPARKVIAVDADNTLWGGIVGEDGVDGLVVGGDAKGILFQEFQTFLLSLRDMGFLLVLCSKNNLDDVKQAFETRKMPLGLDDFVAWRVNWDRKVDNLRALASELDLGLDSFIFIDDSDFEVEAVKTHLPEVVALRFSPEYSGFLELTECSHFRQRSFTGEDQKRSTFYDQEKLRETAKRGIGFEDYIESLGIQLELHHNRPQDLERVSQLTERTNQFNFNKEVLSKAQLVQFLEDGHHILTIEVKDRFGDYGLVGAVFLQKDGRLRNLLLSCRVLGRGVEESFVEEIGSWCAENGLVLTRMEFKETPRNQPAQQFQARARELLLESGSLNL